MWGLRLLRFIPVLVPLLCPFRVRSFQNLASSHGIDWMPIQWALRGVEEVYIRSSIVGNKIYNLCTARKKTVSLHLFDTEMGCLPALHLGSDSMSRPSSFSRTFWGDLGVLESVCMCEGDVVRCRQRKARWQRSLLREVFGYVCESSKQHALLSWYRLPPPFYTWKAEACIWHATLSKTVSALPPFAWLSLLIFIVEGDSEVSALLRMEVINKEATHA